MTFLPHTGIEQPFLKKKVNFIKEAPEFEMIHSGFGGMRLIIPSGGSMQHNLS